MLEFGRRKSSECPFTVRASVDTLLRMGTREMLAAERRDLVDVLQTLTPEEWDSPSLCAEWRVRDVVAHLLYDTMPGYEYLFAVVRNRFDVNRINNRLVDNERSTSPAELLDRLGAIDKGTLTSFTPTVGLADLLVHQQDIRRPLGRHREIDPERLRRVLDHPDPFALTWRNTRGLRFVATDLDWSKGKGPEIRGTGEALVLGTAGRPVVLDELDGDGVAILRERLGAAD